MFLKKEFDEDRGITKNIKNPYEHRSYRDKWLASKQILDKIFNAPLVKNGQEVVVNTQNLSPIELKWLPFIIEKTKTLKIIKVIDKNIFAVIDILKFKNIRTEISNYCFHFQNEGSKKFPKAYSASKQSHCLIEVDRRGNYLYNGQLIKMPQNTLYYNIFDILYSKRDQGGFISFENITEELIKRKKWKETNKKRNSDIINNIHLKDQGFFRYAKINSNKIKNEIIGGRELIEVVRGKGIKLNNPII